MIYAGICLATILSKIVTSSGCADCASCASFWAALVAFQVGFFPRGNAILIAVGVGCFFLSDVCVGFYRSLPKNDSMVFATYLTWVFCAPALVLTALSGYDLDRIPW